MSVAAAYLSPDTLVIREAGNLSFKAIPEEKPLEVIFMAPELQGKGELTEKVKQNLFHLVKLAIINNYVACVIFKEVLAVDE